LNSRPSAAIASDPGVPHQPLCNVGGDELRVADLLDGQHRQIRHVCQEIEGDDDKSPVDQNAGEIFLGVLHLATYEAHVRPTVINPEDRH